jgi:hypothetical protein
MESPDSGIPHIGYPESCDSSSTWQRAGPCLGANSGKMGQAKRIFRLS